MKNFIDTNEKINHVMEFQNKLIQWYKKEARDLPWRSDPSPYKVWISEMMLQQTRVDTVIPYFYRFISEIRNVEELAEVEEDKLLKLWQGLGYYNRALNLKKAAQIIVQKFNGKIPSDTKDLITLPGIGSYSAGAISSIAFGKKVPAVDGNVLRIIARITADREDISSTKAKKQIEAFVADILPLENVGDFNQALMDLGAGICLPNGEPKCGECPVNAFCEASKKGLTSEIPLKAEKRVRKIEKKTVLIISWKDKFALRKRAEEALLPNLWEFPSFEGHLNEKQAAEELKSLGIVTEEITGLKLSKHIFTHLEWHMKGFFVQAAETEHSSNFTWATKEEINSQYSIPTAFKDFVKFINAGHVG